VGAGIPDPVSWKATNAETAAETTNRPRTYHAKPAARLAWCWMRASSAPLKF